ncbi:hypothetical protein, partial [Serratia marcescens]|uniref:hypothetical protein n=1 Tax=Serratia marcescens TaxID=615 RepID=UPI0011E6132D
MKAGPFSLNIAGRVIYRYLNSIFLHAHGQTLKYLVSFRTTLKVSRYLFRALALLLWLLIAFASVFYIVNALRNKEAEIR